MWRITLSIFRGITYCFTYLIARINRRDRRVGLRHDALAAGLDPDGCSDRPDGRMFLLGGGDWAIADVGGSPAGGRY